MDTLKPIKNLESIRTPENEAVINEVIAEIKILKENNNALIEAYNECAERLRDKALEYFKLTEYQRGVVLDQNSEGCILREDWNLLVNSCKVIGSTISDSPRSGYIYENGKDYLPVDIIRTPEEIKEALKVINSFFKVWS